MSMAENNELRILNSFLTKGSFILSQELELVGFLESMILKHLSVTGFAGGGGKGVQQGKGRNSMCYIHCYVCLDCNWVRILSGNVVFDKFCLLKKGYSLGKLFQKSGVLFEAEF